jgi:hypothetical protein
VRSTARAVAALLLILAAGCGGSGGSTTTTPKSSEPVTPPPPAANPEAVLDHYLCYGIFRKEPNDDFKLPNKKIELTDQFAEKATVKIRERAYLCNPVTKNHKKPPFPQAHLVCYALRSSTSPIVRVRISNQFDPAVKGKQEYQVKLRRELCVPSGKTTDLEATPPIPQDVDHFVCYSAAFTGLHTTVKLSDQFVKEPTTSAIRELTTHCNPTDKLIDSEEKATRKHPEAHLPCYRANLDLPVKDPESVKIANQFETAIILVSVDSPERLCVPSTKAMIPNPN